MLFYIREEMGAYVPAMFMIFHIELILEFIKMLSKVHNKFCKNLINFHWSNSMIMTIIKAVKLYLELFVLFFLFYILCLSLVWIQSEYPSSILVLWTRYDPHAMQFGSA